MKKFEVNMAKPDKILNAFLEACADAERDRPRQGVSRLPQFLAAREHIEKALARGWSVRTVWKALREQGRFTGQYMTFLNYVREYVRKAPAKDAAAPPTALPVPKGASAPQARGGKGVKWTPQTSSTSFHYNTEINDDVRKRLFTDQDEDAAAPAPDAENH